MDEEISRLTVAVRKDRERAARPRQGLNAKQIKNPHFCGFFATLNGSIS
ncbi:hypothetical protein ACF8ED_24415 [Pseudomonas sp. zbq_17]|nr:hypothetical protein [Pseudomonas sp. NY5710]